MATNELNARFFVVLGVVSFLVVLVISLSNSVKFREPYKPEKYPNGNAQVVSVGRSMCFNGNCFQEVVFGSSAGQNVVVPAADGLQPGDRIHVRANSCIKGSCKYTYLGKSLPKK